MVVILKRSPKAPYFFIEGVLPSNVFSALEDELSYFIEGAEYSDRYKRGEWDGRECLLRISKNGFPYFPAGLIERVKRVLDGFGIDYDVIEPEFKTRNLNLKWLGPELREYQREAVLTALQKGCGVISLPTGAGKTMIGLKLIHALDCPTLVVVHTKELLYQWVDEIKRVLDYRAGIVGDGHKEFKPITVGMVQTLAKLDIPRFDMLILDEAHHVPANTFFRVAMKLSTPYRFGLSATPKREDGADLKIFAGVGEICANITAEKLIDLGYLAKPKFIFYDLPAIRLPANWHRAYRDGIVLNEYRNNLIAGIVNDLVLDGYRVYVHVERINHGEILASLIDCPFVSGKDSSDKRQSVLDAFKSGRLRAMVSTLLGEGVDIPQMDAIILAQGLKTSIGTIQKIGRALRVRDDKKEAIIVDFIDKGRYLSKHFEERYKTMREYYGKYFKPKIKKKKLGIR